MPFETIVERVFLPMWIIFVPVSACWRWFASATEWNSRTEPSPRRMQLGYFQVIAEPVSTWVQEIFDPRPAHLPRLVTKLKMPPRPSASPAYQFWTVEYLIWAWSRDRKSVV